MAADVPIVATRVNHCASSFPQNSRGDRYNHEKKTLPTPQCYRVASPTELPARIGACNGLNGHPSLKISYVETVASSWKCMWSSPAVILKVKRAALDTAIAELLKKRDIGGDKLRRIIGQEAWPQIHPKIAPASAEGTRFSMCFSAEASFTAAAVLLPAGALTMRQAYRTDRRYVPIAALPLLFGLQQLSEGLVWTAGAQDNSIWVERASLAYMFFSWLAWPVWVPVSAYFLEPTKRKPFYLGFAVAGGILGGIQYVPYFAHEGWMVTRFLPYAISYEGTELLDYITTREVTYAIYVAVVIGPLLLSSVRDVKIFGLLVFLVLAVTYSFFSYAYISVFCFGGALMSLYLVWMVFDGRQRLHVDPIHPGGDRVPTGREFG